MKFELDLSLARVCSLQRTFTGKTTKSINLKIFNELIGTAISEKFNIFYYQNHPANIKVSNKNTRKGFEICSKLTSLTSFCCFYCWLWTRKCRLGNHFNCSVYDYRTQWDSTWLVVDSSWFLMSSKLLWISNEPIRDLNAYQLPTCHCEPNI